MFQSTPPRRGRPPGVRHLCPVAPVSIHAPAQGATDLTNVPPIGDPVSIHAPAQGATGQMGDVPLLLDGFNPRPRAGGDSNDPHLVCPHCVSIHAPAQGATRDTFQQIKSIEFQSTPPRRGRRIFRAYPRASLLFQSTPPRRGRRQASLHKISAKCVSIHAPAQGATIGKHKRTDTVEFQSTPPRRGRLSTRRWI